MIYCVEGLDKINENGMWFKAMLAAKKECSFDNMLGFLTTNMTKLSGRFQLFESI